MIFAMAESLPVWSFDTASRGCCKQSKSFKNKIVE